MDGRWLLFFLLDLAADVAVVDLKLPLHLLAPALIAEIAVMVNPALPFEEQVADQHSSHVGNAGNA